MKIKGLKNLEEKKLCTCIYKQIDHRILYRIEWLFKVRLKPPRSIIQHCGTFSFVNPKRPNTFWDAIFERVPRRAALLECVCRKTSRAF